MCKWCHFSHEAYSGTSGLPSHRLWNIFRFYKLIWETSKLIATINSLSLTNLSPLTFLNILQGRKSSQQEQLPQIPQRDFCQDTLHFLSGVPLLTCFPFKFKKKKNLKWFEKPFLNNIALSIYEQYLVFVHTDLFIYKIIHIYKLYEYTYIQMHTHSCFSLFKSSLTDMFDLFFYWF